MRYSYVRLRFTSKAGVKFLVSPTREEQTVVAMSACAREQTLVSQATPFAVRVWWLAKLGTAVSGEVKR